MTSCLVPLRAVAWPGSKGHLHTDYKVNGAPRGWQHPSLPSPCHLRHLLTCKYGYVVSFLKILKINYTDDVEDDNNGRYIPRTRHHAKYFTCSNLSSHNNPIIPIVQIIPTLQRMEGGSEVLGNLPGSESFILLSWRQSNSGS